MVDPRMDALTWLRKQLAEDCPDLARAMLERIAAELMGAEADALCGAPYGERAPERVNSRNGYRARRWDTRAGTIELEIPKLRAGSYFPDWLITPRRRAEQALMAAIADAYLAGVSTRRVDEHDLGLRAPELLGGADPGEPSPEDEDPWTFAHVIPSSHASEHRDRVDR